MIAGKYKKNLLNHNGFGNIANLAYLQERSGRPPQASCNLHNSQHPHD